MKATMILHGSSSNMVFFSGDQEFIDIFKQRTIDKQMMDPNEAFGMEDLVSHFYGLPSLFINMKATNALFHGFVAEDNTNIQVVQVVGFFLVAIDRKRELDFLHRKLHVLNSIISWFIGPTIKYSPGGGTASRCKLCPEYDHMFPNAQKEAWYLVSCLIEVWEYLYFTDQAFMLDAYEKYSVNVTYTTKYKHLLDDMMRKARIDTVRPNCSIIFSKNKIVEFKELLDPTRDILNSSDLLLILLLVNYLNPSKSLLRAMKENDERNGFFFKESFFDNITASSATTTSNSSLMQQTPMTTPPLSLNRKYSPYNSSTDDRSSLYFDACEYIEEPESCVFEHNDSPTSSTRDEFGKEIGEDIDVGSPLVPTLNKFQDVSQDRETSYQSNNRQTILSSLDLDNFQYRERDLRRRTVTLLETEDVECTSTGFSSRKTSSASTYCLEKSEKSTSKKYSRSSSYRRKELKYQPVSPILVANLRKDYHATLVNCLSKSGDARVPTNLFFIRIPVRDVFIMFSTTHQNQSLARSISQMIQTIDIILSQGVVVSINPYQLSLQGMEQTHGDICDVFKQDTPDWDKITRSWRDCRKPLESFLAGIDVRYGEALTKRVTDRLETSLEKYQNCLKCWYEIIFLGATFGMTNVKQDDFQDFCSTISRDFVQQIINIHGPKNEFKLFLRGRFDNFQCIMKSFLKTFPGLIHFVHVDRSSNQIMAPKLDDERRNLMGVFWKFVSLCRQLLSQRVSYAVWKNGHFTFTYCISFENRQYLDKQGSEKIISQDQMDSIMDDKPIGFLSYNSYYQLKQSLFPPKKPGFDNIVVTETYCMHLLEVPPGFALKQNRKVSEHVWEDCYRKGVPMA